MIKGIRQLGFSIILVGITISTFGQSAKFKRAERDFERLAYVDALNNYLDLIDKPGYEYLASKRAADIYRLTERSTMAEPLYKVIVAMTEAQPEDFLHYSQVLKSRQKYAEAEAWLNKYSNYVSQMPGKINQPLVDYVEQLKADSLNYQISLAPFNSDFADFSPAYFGDNILFISDRRDKAAVNRTNTLNGNPFLDLYISEVYPFSGSSTSKLFPGNLNSKYHEGPVSLSPTGDTLFFTRNNYFRKNSKKSLAGYNNLKIFYRIRTEKGWSKELDLPFNSDEYSNGHPTVSPDGKYLFFVSDRPGGLGKSDVYKVSLEDSIAWYPENLGPNVNTSENEMFPFVSTDNKLYFASNGHAGLGGLDIFLADVNGLEKVKNLGYPLNSPADDFGLILDSTQLKGFFSSNRPGGKGGDDIYEILINSNNQSSFSVKGSVTNSEDGLPISIARIRLLNSTGSFVANLNVDKNGKYKFNIDKGKTYKIEASANGFSSKTSDLVTRGLEESSSITRDFILSNPEKLMGYGEVHEVGTRMIIPGVFLKLTNLATGEKSFSETNINGFFEFLLKPNSQYKLAFEMDQYFTKALDFETGNNSSGRLDLSEVMDLGLARVEIGKAIRLENIYYDLNKTEIRPDAAKELDKLVKLLVENPAIEIELSSHTDSRGSDEFNLSLSDRRTKSALSYIVNQGIPSFRVEGRGYGEREVVNRCVNGVECSEFEHLQNRRTQFKVTKQ
ncbi:MAG: outer membrane protein OmpA-like peptidoglycan-associated protein [Sphingobacteriales bacterium]|jgi:outer membrane protein OmpA-like peptidoglycan-associated protein